MLDHEDDTDDGEDLYTAEEVEEAMDAVRDEAYQKGLRHGREAGGVHMLKTVSQCNGTTEAVVDFLQKAFSEDKVHRDHGKFAHVDGGNDERVREMASVSGDGADRTSVSSGVSGSSDTQGTIVNPDERAVSLASRIAEVPAHIAAKVKDYIQARYAKLSARYGDTAAKAILGATILLLPAPLPGSSLLPVAIAEAVLQIRRAVNGSAMQKAMPPLDDAHIQALARDLLHDLYEEMGESLEQEKGDGRGARQDAGDGGGSADDSGGSGIRNDRVPSGEGGTPGAMGDTKAVARSQLLAALDYAIARHEANDTPDEDVLHRLYALEPDEIEAIAGGTVEKAWDESKHPRADDGRFVSAGDLRDARHSEAKAEELRKQVTRPEERAKLDAAIESKGPTPGRTKRGHSVMFHNEGGRELAHQFRRELVDLTHKYRAGEYTTDDMIDDVGIVTDKYLKKAKAHYQHAYEQAKTLARGDYGEAVLESPEWQKVKESFQAGFGSLKQEARSLRDLLQDHLDNYGRKGWEDEDDPEHRQWFMRRDENPTDKVEESLGKLEDIGRDYQHHIWDALEEFLKVHHDPGKEPANLGRYFKAWSAEAHPRGNDGRFIPKGEIEAAKSDPKKAEELRAKVKPEDAGKLEDALSGKTDLRNARETKRDDTRTRREKVQASRETAKRLADKLQQLQGDATADDYRELIPHLGTLTHKELTYLRTMLSTQGASFGGARGVEERRAKLLAWVQGQLPKQVKERTGPKRRAKVDSVLEAVIDFGGIDPTSHELLTSYETMQRAVQDGIPIAAFKRGGRGLDQLAQELESGGYIHVPHDQQPGSYVLDLLREKAHTLHADLTQEYERAYQEYARALEDAGSEHTPAEVASALRSGSQAGARSGAEDPLAEHPQSPDAEAPVDTSGDFEPPEPESGDSGFNPLDLSDEEFGRWMAAGRPSKWSSEPARPPQPAPPVEPTKPKKPPKEKKPKTAHATVREMAKKETDPHAKDWLQSALHNAKPGDAADLARTLGASIEETGTGPGGHVARPIPASAIDAGRRALAALGALPHGPESGETAFDARYHQPVPGVFPGQAVEVVCPAMVLDGNVVSRGKVKPVEVGAT